MGFPLQVTSGYRTPQEQQALQSTGLAAPVGHSLHEQGNAVDLNWNALKPDQQRKLVDYMTSRGYRWGSDFGEPWHFDLKNAPPDQTPTNQAPPTDANAVLASGTDDSSAPSSDEEDDDSTSEP